MEYFFYCRDRPGTATLRLDNTEAHWSFMDGYADVMIARGPTLSADRVTPTGSMHMVDLPDAEAALVFAFEEPNYKAGVYDEVLVRRWRNALGNTMWDFESDPHIDRRFLIIGHGQPLMTATRQALVDERRHYFIHHGYAERLIECGPLLSDDGAEWIGSAMLVEMQDRAAVDAMLANDPYVQAGLYANVEIHDWRCGGRP